MTDIKLCRICLAADVKMRNMLEYKLQHAYEIITGLSLLDGDKMPQSLCFVCSTLLRKFYLFRKQSRQAFFKLHEILEVKDEITDKELSEMECVTATLVSPLSIKLFDPVNIAPYRYDTAATESLDDIDDLSKSENDGFWSPLKNEYDPLKPELAIKMESSWVEFDSQSVQSVNDGSLQHKYDSDESKSETKFSVEIIEPLNPYVRRGRVRKERITDKTENSKTIESSSKRRKGSVKSKQRTPRKSRANVAKRIAREQELNEFVTISPMLQEEHQAEERKRQESLKYEKCPFKCNLCFLGYMDQVAYKKHLRIHDPNGGDFECDICHRRFHSRDKISKHVANNHLRKFSCKFCQHVCNNLGQARCHYKWHKGVKYDCKHCDKIYEKWTTYMSHLRIKHPSQFICALCGGSFVSENGLTKHKILMHGNAAQVTANTESIPMETEKGRYCEECDIQFESLLAWKKHMVIAPRHQNDPEFSNGCRECGETFPSAEEARLHHRRAHARKQFRLERILKKMKKSKSPSKCEHCDELISDTRKYWHYRRVHPDKKYPKLEHFFCEICGKGYQSNSLLRYHMRSHLEDKPFKCVQCPKEFILQSGLNIHMASHGDRRPFPCGMCAKTFKIKMALTRHMRIHSGEKPYPCDVCCKAFADSSALKAHVKTIHCKEPDKRRPKRKTPKKALLAT